MVEENFEEQDVDNVKEVNIENPQEVVEEFSENTDPPEEVKVENEELKVDNGERVVAEEKKWPGWPGENVFRLLVPAQRVGGVIGRKGETIKKICEETKARIKILESGPGSMERTVMVSAKEEPTLQVPPAVDGLLKIHKHIISLESDPANVRSGQICTRLLVAASQAGSLIGKQGATVKSIEDDSNCSIRVLGEGNLPVFALPDDSVVEIQGDPAGLQKAVELIATHLRKFLVDRSVIGVFEMQASPRAPFSKSTRFKQMQNPNFGANQNSPPSKPWGPPQPAFPMNAGRHGYGPEHSSVAPYPRQYDNSFPPVDMQPRRPPAYGMGLPMGGAQTNNVQQPQAMITKVTQNMQIPLLYADAVIGINGSNISYIRRASGATIIVQEAKGVPDEMTVEINGSSSQVQTAQQLIQNSLAEAISSGQNPGGVPARSQGYNPYASSHGQLGYQQTGGDYNYGY
ncbi:RNA-binding KH domain-containing protein [Striga asiatica]|uniref:RNA-binding KH domain-containing protein n=1 Tax=Striga asiatica TaxID=4170 RepID=A0A5A7REH1_STRAF|nr:RNA-binding KH domain-containing protein [Striga asiatica]